jgi:DNA replication and repair protein RecF
LRIQSVHLTNFRNLTEATAEFGPRRNLIVGENAQGKTSLLEAIHILGVGRSHRDRQDANLVRFGEAFYRIEGSFEHIGVRTTIEVAFAGEKKRIRINRKDARPPALIGLVGVVVSSPDDIDLVKGPPGFRRQFLDVAISQISKDYLATLQQYVRALAQRNRLLRGIQDGKAGWGETEVWDDSLVEAGARIVGFRVAFLEDIRAGVEGSFGSISGRPTDVWLKYEPRGYKLESDDVTVPLREALRSHREMELARGYTRFGPHVDDFSFTAAGMDLRRFGSEGEQRTAVLALRCAEIETMKTKLGRYPIVLLDDVFAELDDSRAEALTALISGFDQIILTSSRLAPGDTADISVIRIRDGRIEAIG